jgi:hypothetical protein
MPTRANTICHQPGCGRPCSGPYCPEHVENNAKLAYNRDRNKETIYSMYNGTRWRRLTVFLRARNAQCQKINNGVRCQRASVLVHHLIAPEIRLDLFYTPSNLVCLCAECHPGGTAGTPEWRPDVDFVPTKCDVIM